MHGEPEPGASWPGLRRVFRLPTSRRRVHDEVSDELWFHIEERIEELMSKGLSRDEAEAEVRRRFGDVARVGEQLEQIDGTAQRRRNRGEWLESLGRDVRYAFRGMAMRPAYTAIIVATLALGIGANTAIFSAVSAVLLRPLPTPELDRVVVVRGSLFKLNLLDGPISPGAASDLMQRRDLFRSSTAYRVGSRNLTGHGAPQRVMVAETMGEFFTTFGVQPFVGRLYRPADSREGAPGVAVLGYALWQELGGDVGLVGREIELHGRRLEIVGVMPPSFRYPHDVQIYSPFELNERVLVQQRWSLYMTFVGRLAPGVSLARLPDELRGELTRWGERLGSAEQHGAKNYGLTAVPLVHHLSGDLRQILLVLGGAVGLVLLIACANVASLQLLRATARSKELAVRVALGAGRGVIARQLLVESLAVALVGGLVGVAVGHGLLGLIARHGAAEYRVLDGVALDGRALAFTAFVTIVAGLAFGTAPALRAARVDLQQTVKGTRGASFGIDRHRFLRATVMLQMALTVVLLAASVVTARSLAGLLATDPGFRPEEVMSVRLSLPGTRYSTGPLRVAFFQSLLERLRAAPGVVAAALVAYPPFTGGSDSSPFDLDAIPARPGEPARHANTQVIAGDYLRVMGIPLLRGRSFGPSDDNPARQVALIDAELARQYFAPGVDPIGKTISHAAGPATIIGVVGSVKQSELDAPLKATVYHYYPHYSWINFTTVVVWSALPPGAVSSIVRSAVSQIDANVPIYDAKPMTERVHASLAARRMAVAVLVGFAGLSLLLAALGIYGVMSHVTRERTRELGIRLALGAEPGALVGMVLRGALMLAGTGVVTGAIVFLGLGRALGALLYRVEPNDPLTLAMSVAALVAATLVACYVPARRAARVDPVMALREE